MPTPDIFTGINDTDILAMENDTQARMSNIFNNLPKNMQNPADLITPPEAPKGLYGTVAPGQNINLDKNSPGYQEAFYQSENQKLREKYPDTFNKMPDILVPQSQTRKYINQDYGYDISRDNEDFYSKEQGPIKELAKSLFLRLPLLTISKLGTGIGYVLGLANPVNWFEKNTVASAADNWFAKRFEDMEDWVKQDFLPLYQTAAARDMGFFKRAMGGDQTFWYGDVLDGAAFMASAFIPGAIAGKLQLGVRALEGIGLTEEAALNASSKFLRSAAEVTRSNADVALITAANTASESMFEAKQVRDDVYSKLIATGKYTEEEAKSIAGEKARNSFMSNLFALSASNLWEANIMLKYIGKGKQAEHIAKLADTGLLEEAAIEVPTDRISKIMHSRLGFYGEKMLEGIGVEGFYEENIQQAIQQYNEKSSDIKGGEKTDHNIFEYTYNVLKTMGKQTIDAIQGKDRDTAMNIGVGALIGAVFGSAGNAISGEYKNEKDAAKRSLDNINVAQQNWLKHTDVYSVDPTTGKVVVDEGKVASLLATQNAHAERMDYIRGAIKDENKKEILSKQEFADLVVAHLNNKSYNHLIDQIDNIKNWNDTDLLKLGFDPEQDNLFGKIEEYKNYAERIKDLKKIVDDIRPGKGTTEGEHVFRQNTLMGMGATREAIADEIGKVWKTATNVDNRIEGRDGTDELVSNINVLKLRIASQELNLKSANEESKDGYETRLNKYKSDLERLEKDNEETLKDLKKDKDGYYKYKNDEKMENPLINELYKSHTKLATLYNARQDITDEFNKLFNNKGYAKEKYDKQVEILEKVAKEAVEKMKQEEDLRKKEEATKAKTNPTGKADVQTTDSTPEPEKQGLDEEAKRKEEYLSKVRDLINKKNEDSQTAKTKKERDAVTAKYLKDMADLKEQYASGTAPVITEPVASDKKFKEIKSLIPKGKVIHTNDHSELMKTIGDARRNNQITDEQEGKLIDIINDKKIAGTGFDSVTLESDDEEGKDESNEDDNVGNPTLTVIENTDPVTTENPEVGHVNDEYDPNTADVPDPNLDEDLISLLAWQTSLKTVTQEELQNETGRYTNALDEDPYKQFKQNYIRHLLQVGMPKEGMFAKIIKDNDELPRSKETKDALAAGVPYGEVLVLTDSDRNTLYFDENYISSTDKKEGTKPMVYSFTRTYWQKLGAQRAGIGALRTGLNVENFTEQYDNEEKQMEAARKLTDQGKEVPIEIVGISPGASRLNRDPVKTSLVIKEGMNPRAYIAPAPYEKFDPENPEKTRYSIVGSNTLLNGALYAEVIDPDSNIASYVRMIPNKISEIPELFGEIKDLLTHNYDDANEAGIAADYLKQVLFIDRTNRPTIRLIDQENGKVKVSILSQGELLADDVALTWIETQRVNVLRNNVNSPDEYAALVIKDGKLETETRLNYNKFLMENSTTRQIPISTSKGNKLLTLNSYFRFKFIQSLATLNNSETSGKDDLFKNPPGERVLDFDTETQVPVFRHVQTNEDATGKTSGTNGNVGLNETGKKEAARLGEVLAHYGIKKIVSSNVERAIETAVIAGAVAKISAKNIIKDGDLRTWDIGQFAGLPTDQFDERWFVEHPLDTIHNGKKVGESYNTYRTRMILAFNKYSKIGDKNLAVISHSRNIRFWDALKRNNGLINDTLDQMFLDSPSQYGFTSFTRKEEKSDNSTLTNDPIKKSKFSPKQTNTEQEARKFDEEQRKQKGLNAIANDEVRPLVQQSEIDKVNSMFGHEVMSRIATVADSNIWATWNTSGISLYRDAQEGTGYHEAWHNFSQIYLSQGEKTSLYNEVRKRNIDFTSRQGEKLNTKTASDFDVEEFMADDFKDYVLSNGKSRLVDRPYRNTIFRRILDFIKSFFFGDVNISKLYNDLYNGQLNHYTPSINNAMWGRLNSEAINQKGNDIFNDNQKAEYYYGLVDALLGQKILGAKTSIEAMNKSRQVATSLYNDVYNELLKYYEPLESNENKTPKQEEVLDDLNTLLSNWEDFAQYHKDRSKLEINIPGTLILDVPSDPREAMERDEIGTENYEIKDNTDEITDDSEELKKEVVNSDKIFDKNGAEYSSLESATPETKGLIRMLLEMQVVNGNFIVKLDENGFPRLNDYGKTWNNLSIELAGTTRYEEMIQRLNNKDVQLKVPEITELLKHLPDPFNEMTPTQFNTAIKFRRDFGKPYVGIFSGRMYEDGDYFFNEETKRNRDQIMKLWSANFFNKPSTDPNVVSNDILVESETGKYYINPSTRLTYDMRRPEEKENLLNLLGFTFSPETKNQRFYNVEMGQYLKNIMDNINSRLEEGQRIYNPVYDLRQDLKDTSGKVVVHGMKATLNAAFLDFEAKYSSEVPSMSYRTSEGTMKHGIRLNNTMTIMVNKLNNATSYNDIINDPAMQHLNIFNNPYVRGSLFLNRLFQLDTSRPENFGRRWEKNQIVIGDYDGFRFQDSDDNFVGYSTTSLNVRQKVIFDMNSLLAQGAAEIMRTEVSKSAYFSKMKFYNTVSDQDKSKSYLPVGIGEFSTSFNSPTFRRLMIDSYLNDELDRMKNAKDVDIFKNDERLLRSAENFNLFRDILSIREEGKDREGLKNTLKNDIKTMSVEGAIAKNRKAIEKALDGFLTYEYNSFREILKSENVTKSDMGKNIPKSEFNQQIRAFLANNLILNVEHTKLFDGDTIYQAHYKDYFKRSKGATSTGIVGAVDDFFAREMKKGESQTFGGFVQSKVANDYKTARTINIEDDIRRSKYLEINKQDLKKGNPNLTDEQIDDILKAYSKINIGDGQGHITLDFYRQFLMSIGNWSDDQEKMYRIELAKYRLDHFGVNPNYSQMMRQEDRDFLEKNDGFVAFFPPLKIQYNGPIQATGTFASVMDKFSVAPLIYSVIKGKPLEDLHDQMITHGIAYSKYLSGTKKYQHPPIKMYDEQGYRGVDLSGHKPAVHFLEFLKEQINTKSDIKTESIFGSQVRKLIESNIFSSGIAPEIAQERHQRYLSLINGLMNIGKEELFKDLSIEERIDPTDKKSKLYINNVEKFIATLKSQAKLRDMNDNVIQYIQYNPDTKLMMYPLEGSLNRKAIQDLIMGEIDRKLRLQKIAGDQLIQVSSSGYETKGFKYTKATDEEIKKYGTNDLGFYHIGEDGRTVSAQVKVGLNGGFEALLNKTHPDGSKIRNLDRLNELLKDDAWRKENRDHITIIGYRIPTQGYNSMEVMEVKEFLPPHVGSSIIVPAEIVAKAGSDFDIDKLSIFRPSFDENGNIIKDNSKKGYSNKIIDLYKEILTDPASYKQLITPNSTDKVEPEINELAVALGKRQRSEVFNNETGKYDKVGTPYSGTQIYRYKNNVRKFESLLSASKLLGVFAVNNSFITLLQQAGTMANQVYTIAGKGYEMVRPVKMLLLSSKEKTDLIKDGKIDVGSRYNAEGELKQDYFSQLINATVDAPSNDFFGYANITYENVGVLSYLMNFMGVPFNRAIWFVNQPVLVRYYSDLRRKNINETKSEIKVRLMEELLNKSFRRTDFEGKPSAFIDYKAFNLEINRLLNGTDKRYSGKYFNKDSFKKIVTSSDKVDDFVNNRKVALFNAEMLAYFLSLQEQSQIFRQFQGELLVDTRKIQSPLSVYQSAEVLKDVSRSRLLNMDEYKKIATNSVVAPFENKSLIQKIAFRLMPAAYNPTFMGKIATRVQKTLMYESKEVKRRAIANTEQQWTEFIVKSLGKIGGYSLSSYQRYLLEGQNNIARRFNNLITDMPQLKEDYPFVSKIRPNFPNRPGINKANLEVSRIFENNQNDQNRYIEEFRKLINFDNPNYTVEQQEQVRDFFKDLAILGFVQSGFTRSNISFQELVPYEQLADIIRTAIKNFQSYIVPNQAIKEKFINEFVRQFDSNIKKGKVSQAWRGRDYFLPTDIKGMLEKSITKEDQIKSQINLEARPSEEAPKEEQQKQLPPPDTERNIFNEENSPFLSDQEIRAKGITVNTRILSEEEWKEELRKCK